MASRGWENITARDLQRMHAAPVGAAKPSKYKNVKVTIDGHTFDSKRESNHYLLLKSRLAAGEISDLRCQVAMPLCAPVFGVNGEVIGSCVVAHYVADFTYTDTRDGRRHVVDAKGVRTALYALKAKWLAIQDGTTIEEV